VEENGASVPVELSLGGEYMLDSHFMDRFEEGFLTLDREGVLVLCETSYLNREPGAKEHLYEIMLKGYQPVIAHPERYQYADKAMYQRWKQRDYLFQLNLLSLGGAYGGPAKAKALQLLKDGMYDYVGSDLHRLNSVEEWVRSIRLTKKETDQLLKLLENNKTL
jgi:tyrosine-protein phosphatase YwqE